MAEKINLGDKPPTGEKPPRTTRRAGGRAGSSGDGSGAAAAAPRKLTPTDKKLHDSLTGFYNTVGVGITSVGMMRSDIGLATAGVNVGAMADGTADAWIELAQQNSAVRKMLEGFVQGSAVATLLGMHVAMVVPVLTARGVVPPEVGNMMLTKEAKEAAAVWAAQAQQAQAQQNGNGDTPAAA